LPLITFAGSEWNAISRREVNGRFTLASEFVAPHPHGMQELPPTEHAAVRKLFTLRTSICPTLDEDEQTRRWTLIELAEDSSASRNSSAEDRTIEDWLKELGLATMAQTRRFQSIAHKQFRDATDANRACYQALVALEREFAEPAEIEWIREQLEITIHQFDSMQIAKKFGLEGGIEKVDRNGRRSLIFQPAMPFCVRGGMKQSLGTNLCWRAGTMNWQHDGDAK
jgi:hypothetical protein